MQQQHFTPYGLRSLLTPRATRLDIPHRPIITVDQLLRGPGHTRKPSSLDSSIKSRENEREAFAQTISRKGNDRHRTSSRRRWPWLSRAAERQAAETDHRTRGRSQRRRSCRKPRGEEAGQGRGERTLGLRAAEARQDERERDDDGLSGPRRRQGQHAQGCQQRRGPEGEGAGPGAPAEQGLSCQKQVIFKCVPVVDGF